VTVEDSDGVRVVVIDRPEVANAVDLPTAVAIDAALRELEERHDLRVGVLTGSHGYFSAGKDIKAFGRGEPEALIADRGFAGLTRACRRTPLIAAVDGPAVGGGFELALACDLIVASTRARFAAAEVSRGLVASEGGLLRLVNRLPRAIAAELLLTGRSVAAQEAAAFGLVNRVTEPAETLPTAMRIASGIVATAPLAVGAVTELLRTLPGRAESDGFAMQDQVLRPVFESDDAREGLLAYLGRRPPRWIGR
jgi:enoyl-CoA hydratase